MTTINVVTRVGHVVSFKRDLTTLMVEVKVPTGMVVGSPEARRRPTVTPKGLSQHL